jgi:para-aminobenzoate synthetase/4-amino-4-deoxychorismate lyase
MPNPLVFLDDARQNRERLSLFAACEGVVEAHDAAQVEPALAALARASAQGLYAAGYFSYELGYLLEPKLKDLLPERRAVPLLWFGLFRSREEVCGAAAGQWLAERASGRAYAGPLRYAEELDSYTEKFARIADYIRSGDIYQANLTFAAGFDVLGDPLALYQRLRGRARAGHGGYIFDGRRTILSFSPELFFRAEKGTLTLRPMKGTRPRGRNGEEDSRLLAALRASEKDRAENLMIVDLIRNDAGRVAHMGSVKTSELFEVETYPTVHQMVSTVTAKLRPDAAPGDILRALFPCGSVTGAPKIRAMEIIRELESGPRGLYCGAIGCFSPDGSAEFNVAIRTLTLEGGKGALGIGGGIVADSLAPAEYAECLIKARYYSEERPKVSLIETLRHDPDEGYVRGESHLARLAASARAFGLPFDKDAALNAMADAVENESAPSRLRLELFEDGKISAEARAFAPDASVWTYAVSERRVQSEDQLARHKTSWRSLYDEEFARLHAATACDQVLFLNERGEVAEGNTANLFLRREGRLLTPPLSAGILDGRFRRDLIAKGACEEAVLLPADLETGEVYFGNSLRDLIRSRPVRQAALRSTI